MSGTRAKRRQARSRGDKTEAELLDAAEELFAERGYDGTSIRAIVELANSHLGALHYYFGNKEALFRATVERRLRPASDERMLGLEQCQAGPGGQPDLEAVLHAYIDPMVQLSIDHKMFDKLMLRTLNDPAEIVQETFRHLFDESTFLFVRLLRQATAHLTDEEFYWRLPTVIGAIQFLLTKRSQLMRLSHGRHQPVDVDTGVQQTIAGLKAVLLALSTAN